MSSLKSRLLRLEQQSLPTAPAAVRCFWYEELRACKEHPRCDIELATGMHHQDGVHLTLDGDVTSGGVRQ
jgi:hypothetical protein